MSLETTICLASMSIASWCAYYGITKANYYRLYRVREICSENLAPETLEQQIVPVNSNFLWQEVQKGNDMRQGAFHFYKWFFCPCNGIHTHATACGGS